MPLASLPLAAIAVPIALSAMTKVPMRMLSMLGSPVVVRGLPLLQRPPLQFQKSQAQLKLQLYYLPRQFSKLVSDGFAHGVRFLSTEEWPH